MRQISFRIPLLIFLCLPDYGISQDDGQVAVAPEYEACQGVLWSEPANTLSEFVAKGYGDKLSSGDLEDQVQGLRCSDAQIIAYMEHHGQPFHSEMLRENVFDGIQGSYNRILDFCRPNRSLFRRVFSGKCGGVTRFMMVDDKVSYIVSHGFK